MVVEHPAVAGDEHDVMGVDLTFAALPARLDDAFRHRGHAPQVIAGKLPTAGVDLHASLRAERAAGSEWSALAFGAEPVVLERHQHRERVAVVELEDVDIPH